MPPDTPEHTGSLACLQELKLGNSLLVTVWWPRRAQPRVVWKYPGNCDGGPTLNQTRRRVVVAGYRSLFYDHIENGRLL